MKLNETSANSNGIYSLYNGWLKEPVKDDIPVFDLEPELSEWIEKSENCNTVDEINNFIDDIYKLRQESILKDGEYGRENLIFKEIRNRGILQGLKDKKVELENKEMSLEETMNDRDKLIQDLYSKYEDKLNSNSDIDRIFDEIMNEYDDPDLAGEVTDYLQERVDDTFGEALNEKEDDEVVEESLEEYLAKRDRECIEDYRTRACISESTEITEDNLDDWAMRSTSCYLNYDINDLRKLLLGGNK